MVSLGTQRTIEALPVLRQAVGNDLMLRSGVIDIAQQLMLVTRDHSANYNVAGPLIVEGLTSPEAHPLPPCCSVMKVCDNVICNSCIVCFAMHVCRCAMQLWMPNVFGCRQSPTKDSTFARPRLLYGGFILPSISPKFS